METNQGSDLSIMYNKMKEDIKNMYDHKMRMITPTIPDITLKNESDRSKIERLFMVVDKDLALAKINDDYSKYLYQFELHNIQNWLEVGLLPLAMKRYSILLGELHLERSKEAFERILQEITNLSGNVNIEQKGGYKHMTISPQQPQQQEQQPGLNMVNRE